MSVRYVDASPGLGALLDHNFWPRTRLGLLTTEFNVYVMLYSFGNTCYLPVTKRCSLVENMSNAAVGTILVPTTQVRRYTRVPVFVTHKNDGGKQMYTPSVLQQLVG